MNIKKNKYMINQMNIAKKLKKKNNKDIINHFI